MNPGDNLYVTVQYDVDFFPRSFKKDQPYPATCLSYRKHSVRGFEMEVRVEGVVGDFSIRPPSRLGSGTTLQVHPLTFFNKNLEEILK